MVSSLFDFRVSGLYAVHAPEGRPVLRWLHGDDGGTRSTGYQTEALAGALTTFDPELVRTTRLQASTMEDLEAAGLVTEHTHAEMRRLSRKHFGFVAQQQLRALVTDGRTLLACIGGVSDDPRAFSGDERARLDDLVPRLQKRLTLERQLLEAPLYAATLDRLLETLVQPVFLVDDFGQVALANQPARSILEQAPTDTRIALKEARSGRSPEFERMVVEGPGIPRHHLLVRRAKSPDGEARLVDASRRWRTSPRETEVLRLVARGHTNADIARELGISLRTLELHVTRLFDKAGVDNRATLIARFWTGQ